MTTLFVQMMFCLGAREGHYAASTAASLHSCNWFWVHSKTSVTRDGKSIIGRLTLNKNTMQMLVCYLKSPETGRLEGARINSCQLLQVRVLAFEKSYRLCLLTDCCEEVLDLKSFARVLIKDHQAAEGHVGRNWRRECVLIVVVLGSLIKFCWRDRYARGYCFLALAPILETMGDCHSVALVRGGSSPCGGCENRHLSLACIPRVLENPFRRSSWGPAGPWPFCFVWPSTLGPFLRPTGVCHESGRHKSLEI